MKKTQKATKKREEEADFNQSHSNTTVGVITTTTTTTTMEQVPKALIIDPPHDLRFVGPFNRPVITYLKLTNPTDHVFLFKIKTTAPKRYCVRPNFGSVEPKQSAKVEICLQPFAYEPFEKNKHKFMVQSIIPPTDCEDYATIWKEADPSQIMDAKLKCFFEMPPGPSNNEKSLNLAPEVTKDYTPEEKVSSAKNISNLQTSDQADTMLVELRQLREENTSMRKEVINLKEQVVRLQCSPSKPPMDEPYAPMMAEKQIPIFYIAISIAAAIFGLLLGKYLL